MVLTDKQRSDLHGAIYEYLRSQSDLAKFATDDLKAACGGGSTSSSSGIPMLEKKWSIVVRMQKRILELESKVKELEAERKQFVGAAIANGASNGFKRGETYLLKSTCLRKMSGHRNSITSVRFHPRFNLVVSTSEDATGKVWDFETGEFERTLKGHTNAVQDAAFNEDGTLLATCSSDMTIKLWDFSPGGGYECIKTLMGHDHSVSGVAFLGSGVQQLVSCSRDKSIKIWDTSSGYCLKTLLGHTEWVRKVVVHRETNTIASCSSDHSIRVWSAEHGEQCVLHGHEHVVECLAFSSSTVDRTLKSPLLTSNGEETSEENVSNNNSSSGSGGGSANNKGGLYLASGSRDKTIKIWQVSSGSCLFTLSGHDNWVQSIGFQPLGKYLISVSEDKTIRLWDLQQQKCVRNITNAHDHFISCLDIHPNLAVVATGSVDKEIGIWVASI